MKNRYIENIRQELKQDIEWSVRYLGIYNLSRPKAYEVIDHILIKLSQITIDREVCINMRDYFTSLLKLQIEKLKESHLK